MLFLQGNSRSMAVGRVAPRVLQPAEARCWVNLL